MRDAVEDPVELVPAVGMSGPERVEAVEPGEIPECAFRRIGHGHLTPAEAEIALGRIDPEALGRLLVAMQRVLAGGSGARKKRAVKRIGLDGGVMKCER
jgi:hypothetical protein